MSVLDLARGLWRRRVDRPPVKALGVKQRYALLREAADVPKDTGAALALLKSLGLALHAKAHGEMPDWWRQEERTIADSAGRHFDLVTGLPISVARKSDSASMVLIPGGSFLMGWPEEDCRWVNRNLRRFNIRPDVAGGVYQRRVILAPYYLSVESVTRTQYHRFRPGGLTKRNLKANGDHPVTEVTWFDAKAYAQWAGAVLPTEAQWERAARGGRQCRYPWGDEPPDSDRLNFEDHYGITTPVCSFPPNPFGLFDMAGNVYDWCADWYSRDYYAIAPHRDPRGPNDGDTKVLRGASWVRWAPDDSGLCHVAFRHSWDPTASFRVWGFRCVVNLT